MSGDPLVCVICGIELDTGPIADWWLEITYHQHKPEGATMDVFVPKPDWPMAGTYCIECRPSG